MINSFKILNGKDNSGEPGVDLRMMITEDYKQL
jgi:hypothetical protein